jgi:hypothetical protein
MRWKQSLNRAPTASREQLARQLGFASFLEMFEASTPVTDDNGLPWCVTPDRSGMWIAWNERERTLSPRFSTAANAIGPNFQSYEISSNLDGRTLSLPPCGGTPRAAR